MFLRFTALFYALIIAVSGVGTRVVPAPQGDGRVSQQVKILTFNVLTDGSGKNSAELRAPGVIEEIKELEPDSVGLCEANRAWYARFSRSLPEYSYVGLADGEINSGEHTGLLYLTRKFRLVNSGVFWLSDTPDESSKGWDGWVNRICVYAELQDRKTGFKYVHFATHLDNIGGVARLKGMELVLDRIAGYDPRVPVVLSGDFNSEEGSALYEYITKRGMLDAKTLAKKSDVGGTFHFFIGLDKIADRPIDFVFFSPGVSRVDEYSIIRGVRNGVFLSDHFPVFVKAELEYRP